MRAARGLNGTFTQAVASSVVEADPARGPGLVITTICHLPSAVINPQPTFVRPPSALEEYQCVPLRRRGWYLTRDRSRGLLQVTRCDGSATSAHPWYEVLT